VRTSRTSRKLPPEARRALDFVLVDSIEDVFAAAFNGRRTAAAAPRARAGAQAARALRRCKDRRRSG
jgi:hypothetical protein